MLNADQLPPGFVLGRLEGRVDWAPGLATLNVEASVMPGQAGQFHSLALVDPEGALIRRVYSLASAPGAPLEFLVVEVPGGILTPALFALNRGDSLILSERPEGNFHLGRIPDARDLWLVSTGTGIAPYLAMLRTPEPWARFQRIVLVHGVRLHADLAYRPMLEGMDLVYLPVVSREPAALQGRIPALLRDGSLEAAAGVALDAGHSQVMLCGNPEMTTEVQELLLARGLRKNRPRAPGQVTDERYW